MEKLLVAFQDSPVLQSPISCWTTRQEGQGWKSNRQEAAQHPRSQKIHHSFLARQHANIASLNNVSDTACITGPILKHRSRIKILIPVMHAMVVPPRYLLM